MEPIRESSGVFQQLDAEQIPSEKSSAFSEPIQMCQGFDMTHFDGIYDIAADGHGIVAAAQA